MKFIQGSPRQQTSLFPISLDNSISEDNIVRIIDLFVSGLNLNDYGFEMCFIENGRPAYHPSDLLKLFIYGYMNRIRSSRGLEKECCRNIEVMWLLNSLKPDHNTISNFRKDNGKAIKNVFRATVSLAKHFELIGGELIAGDSTKLRAQNSKKNNFNQKKIDRHLEYIESKLAEYNQALAENDGDKQKEEETGQQIKKQKARKRNYKSIEKQLKETCEVQEKCTTSRKNGKIVQRRKNAQNIDNNRVRIENNIETYKKRQAIVEHPYGTIKRQWGFSYIMTKKFKHRASSDVGLIMTAYNLRRIINILGIDLLKDYLEMVVNTLIYIFVHIRLKKTSFKVSGFLTFNMQF